MNIERKRKLECLDAQCGFTKERCLIYHGRECVKLGGKRIPLQSATANHTAKVEAQTNGMKGYYIQDEWETTEGREY